MPMKYNEIARASNTSTSSPRSSMDRRFDQGVKKACKRKHDSPNEINASISDGKKQKGTAKKNNFEASKKKNKNKTARLGNSSSGHPAPFKVFMAAPPLEDQPNEQDEEEEEIASKVAPKSLRRYKKSLDVETDEEYDAEEEEEEGEEEDEEEEEDLEERALSLLLSEDSMNNVKRMNKMQQENIESEKARKSSERLRAAPKMGFLYLVATFYVNKNQKPSTVVGTTMDWETTLRDQKLGQQPSHQGFSSYHQDDGNPSEETIYITNIINEYNRALKNTTTVSTSNHRHHNNNNNNNGDQQSNLYPSFLPRDGDPSALFNTIHQHAFKPYPIANNHNAENPSSSSSSSSFRYGIKKAGGNNNKRRTGEKRVEKKMLCLVLIAPGKDNDEVKGLGEKWKKSVRGLENRVKEGIKLAKENKLIPVVSTELINGEYRIEELYNMYAEQKPIREFYLVDKTSHL